MNVLVYSGPEVLDTSTQSLQSLRSLLVPNYAIQTINFQSLASQPWAANCAMLVLPACRSALVPTPPFASAIKSYVERGGALLALGASARRQARQPFAGETLEARMARMNVGASSASALRFSDRTSGTLDVTLPGHGEGSYRVDIVEAQDGSTMSAMLSGKAEIVEIEGWKGAEVLGRYGDRGSKEVAGVCCPVGEGKVVFWSALADHSLTEEPVKSILARPDSQVPQQELITAEAQRLKLLRTSFASLGLRLPSDDRSLSRPLPQFLTGTPLKSKIIERITAALSATDLENGPHVLQDSNDTFHFHAASEGRKLLEEARTPSDAPSDSSIWQPKHIIVCTGGNLPSKDDTPLFDISKYYAELDEARHKHVGPTCTGSWGVGEALLYGEVVTSTQTMLDKNPRFMSLLPTPFLSLATHQLAGRGRGGNVWISPAGCLQFSLLLYVPMQTLPTYRVVFVQYLFGLVVVEACRDAGVLGKLGGKVRLKWPNDIYVVLDDGEKRKIGGVLVNTSFNGGSVEVIIGCGLNVLNPPPTTSLQQLVPPDVDIRLSMERTAAVIMAKFEEMWNTFLINRGSFAPFMDLYLERWLHSDQLVTLTTTNPPQQVRVVGITPNHGLLRTMPERGGWSGGNGGEFIDLQPDGNSFDLMAGLIKTKS
ncbi:class II aaRS and biotin synthetase [Obba rivulosa]|uniref:Class II aaRS and biotin synthetase n=1 Tax=Obba rivulosa TaxID=1052685 RepID=A0A8E2DMX2_9APHY|nr:class II aaRS and biotin synthetase [Obba rivulosa]